MAEIVDADDSAMAERLYAECDDYDQVVAAYDRLAADYEG
jgi:hypothetical protein